MSRAVVLFTRDLRVHDHAPLAAAVREHEEVLPLFVLDRELLSRSCGAPNRLSFLLDCLRDLDGSLRERGAALIVRSGEVVSETLALALHWRASEIYLSADATPYARERQRRLGEEGRRSGIGLRTFAGINLLAPGELTPAGGDHYRVFTPYWRLWSARPTSRPAGAPRTLRLPPELPTAPAPELSCAPRGTSPDLATGGEREGRRLRGRWLRDGVQGYEAMHDDLAAARTSHLSAHLHFGSVSPRSLLSPGGSHTGVGGASSLTAAELSDPGLRAFARQLCWRDFHHQVLAARPDIPHADYRSRGRRWREDAQAAGAWRAGTTGYPIVDAGMRQLLAEGFIHNRARLIVASFLTKTLGLHWRIGAAHFARLLLDADVANNVGNWQWVAGTGNDTRPNRVLNPLRQATRFDPHGDYVRRYLPELSSVPGRAVHEPWRLPGALRRSLRYPAPIAELGANSPAANMAGARS